ncbi:helix-turn-helix domain-containing protein [Cuniculiplasma sp. SKW3]|uniref:helix-turn-helix domain-containing protein n=1 Tax=Cuniculiplasma sp. SKW3 TaxID=3400170 RepID=UPI003FD1769A
MISDINILTSPAKVEITHILRTPKTPDQIAATLHITRQGIDKHLKEMVKYGIVDRKWFMGSRRPRIEYFLTEAGAKFYRELDSIWKNHIILSESYINEKIRTLDLKLADGAIDGKTYSDEIKILKDSLEFMKKQGD